nr:MAG TPA: hypothetical protein [Caudoviricetes sp.]
MLVNYILVCLLFIFLFLNQSLKSLNLFLNCLLFFFTLSSSIKVIECGLSVFYFFRISSPSICYFYDL